MLEITVPPQTTETVTLTVTAPNGTPVTGATVTAVFRDPDLRILAASVVFTDAGSGRYTTIMDPAWTTQQGAPRMGTCYLDVTVQTDASVMTARVTVHVRA